ncbi:hypothetical protein Tco_1055932 [Tanacetum coccineum]|uniref:Uncharacterized protein n=1 Tax=Tanacetum coccineum TaxID=301880 RepID=A0ABQ5H130_9ASTR
MKEVVKESGAKRKKSLPRKRRIVKRQKLEEDAEKEELKDYTFDRKFLVLSNLQRDGISQRTKSLSEMLEDLIKQDVEEFVQIVKESIVASDQKNGIAIHMLTEKKYPLSQEMLTKMLNRKLEVDHESSQAFELLSTNGVSTASTYLVLPELVNTARRRINTADGQSC